jgi:hypothetical protein
MARTKTDESTAKRTSRRAPRRHHEPSPLVAASDEAHVALERVEHALKKPSVGAAVAGGAVLAAAGIWGASEAAVGALAAYGVYRLLTRGQRRQLHRQAA